MTVVKWLSFIFVPALLLVTLGGAASETTTGHVVAAIACVSMITLAIYGQESSKCIAGLKLDVQRRVVDVYEGVPEDNTVDDDSQEKLVKKKLLRVKQHQSLEVLPNSAMVYSTNGRHFSGVISVIDATTAGQPEGAAIAAQWLEEYQDEDVRYFANFRELTQDEAEEMLRHARRNMYGLLWACLGAAYFAFRGIATYLSGSRDWIRLSLGALAILLLPVFLLLYLSDIRLAIRLRRDAAMKQLQILKGPNDSDPTFEVTYHSDMVWTENGVPSAWRRVR